MPRLPTVSELRSTPYAVDDVQTPRPGECEHLGDLLGRILQVSVEAHHVLAERQVQAGGERRLMAGVAPQPDHPQLRPGPADAQQLRRRRVRAAVVDRDDLVRRAKAVEDGTQPVHEQRAGPPPR